MPYKEGAISLRTIDRFAEWGLATEMAGWGFEVPSAQRLYNLLLEHHPVEYTRVGAFQVYY